MKSFKDTAIGREFLAGKCSLRVTKEGWAEFAKMCDEAEVGCICGEKVGSHVCNPWGNWEYFFVGGKTLDSHAGQETASRRVTDFSALCAEPEKPAPKFKSGDLLRVKGDYANDVFKFSFVHSNGHAEIRNISTGTWSLVRPDDLIPYTAPTTRKIIITTDGTTTTARLIEGKTTIKTATAKCSPEDTFDFDKGARLAFDRLVPRKGDGCLEIEVSCDVKPALDAVQEVHAALDKLAARVERMAAK